MNANPSGHWMELLSRARVDTRARGRGMPDLRSLCLAAAVALGLGWAAPAPAAAPAGTPIPNTASGTIAGGGIATSNTVTAFVQALESLELIPDRGAAALPGTAVAFAHRLTNLGNAATSVRLDAANLGGDGFDLAGLTLYRDLNGDGLLDPGDAPLAGGAVVPLASAGSMDLLLAGTVPAAAAPLAIARVSVVATGLTQGALAIARDSVRTPAAATPPALGFYADAGYGQTIRVSALGLPLFVQAAAPGCNFDALSADTIAIELRSALTGDRDTFRAVESGAGTGIFRITPSVTTASALGAAASGDGLLTTRRGDLVTAELAGCGAAVTLAQLWIEPFGVVFDARTGSAVAGAAVTLLDVTGGGNGGVPGGLARVWQNDGVTPAPSRVISDGQGRFQFPRVAASTYRLEVVPPSPYAFPPAVAPSALPAGFLVDAAGSYGAPFAIGTPDSPVALDLPVDGGARVTLFAEKSASRAQVELGEALEYSVRIANRSDSSFAAASMTDALPAGFAYLPGTARRDGVAIADPSGGAGPGLDFALGALAPGEVTTVRYGVRVGAGASFGEAVNRVVARAGSFESNEARSRVRVEEGLFAQSGAIVGVVRLVAPEAVADASSGAGTGVAGVRVWLDDGTFAITDGLGRYSLTGVTPRTHALKVDPSSLPPGSRLVAQDNRDGGQPGLRFVDLSRGDLQRAEFFMTGDSATTRDVGERWIAGAGRRDDLARTFGRGTAPLVNTPVAGDPRALPAQAVTSGEAESSRPASWSTAAPSSPGAAPPGATAPPAPAPPPTLDEIARGLDSDLGFLGIADLDTVRVPQIGVRVKGMLGEVLTLRVNGERISESRVGLRVTAPENQVEVWEYVGIALKPGVNVLEVAPPRSIGRVAVRVVAPGPLARVTLEAPARAAADGRSTTLLRVGLRDAAGVPVGDRTLVTLSATRGALLANDLSPDVPGTQVTIENGEALIPLQSPATTGDAVVSAVAGPLHVEVPIRFVSDQRPLMAVGAVEGVVGFGRSGTFGHGGGGEGSNFEATIDQFASARTDGRAMAAAHGAVFARGRVRDDLALTLGYDSDRPRDLRRQRDMQPENGYPLLGDGATRGYDAQSTGRLYARLERGESSLLYGDFVTRDAGNPRSLSAYNRSLTGVQSHWEQGAVGLDAFTSRDRSRQGVEELRGLGISGPYELRGAPIVENSERVEVVIRDRHQPAVVLSRSVRQRFVDYELDAITGRLTFRAPIPGFDADLDPVSIRVTYETAGGGEAFWVSGLESRVKLGERVELGGTYVDDHEIGAERQLRGVSLSGKLGAHSRLETELAASRRLGEAAGLGSRLELAHESPAAQGRLWLAATGERFENPGAGFAPGRTEGGGRFAAKLSERTRFTSEALWSADAFGRDRRAGLLAALDRPLSDAVRGEFGVRVAGERRRDASAPPASAALRTRLTLQLPGRPAWSGYAEAEQDVRDLDRRMLAVGGEHRFSSRGRFYARHELVTSLAGPFGFNAAERQLATVAGVDADVARDAHLFSEYRLGDSFAGRESQAAVGLRNGWRLAGGVRLGTSFERVSTLAGGNPGAATAVSASMDQVEDPNWRGSSRFEVRSSRSGDSFLQTMSAAVRLDSAWTALFRHHFDLTDAHGAPGAARVRLQMGAAWRPGTAWDALGRWEFRYDREGRGPAGDERALPTGAADLLASRRRLAQILALQTTGKLDRHFVTALAWAGKRTRDEALAGATRGGAQWARARATLDLARGWDVGVQSSVLIGESLRDHRYGTGAEIGRQMSPGVWLSLGYNHFGYRDDELTGSDWTRAGAYLRLRAKFDERLFGLDADGPLKANDAPVNPAAAPRVSKPPVVVGGDPR